MRQFITVALADDYALVAHGLRRMLLPFRSRVQVVDLTRKSAEPLLVDIVLFDVMRDSDVVTTVQGLARQSSVGKLVFYTWNPESPLVAEVLQAGAVAVLSKALTAVALVEAVEKIHAGEPIPWRRAAESTTSGSGVADAVGFGDLSPREVEVLKLITRGWTNTQIAAELYLTANSVKSYIRNAYRKIGVVRRSQAVVWGITHHLGEDSGQSQLGTSPGAESVTVE